MNNFEQRMDNLEKRMDDNKKRIDNLYDFAVCFGIVKKHNYNLRTKKTKQ